MTLALLCQFRSVFLQSLFTQGMRELGSAPNRLLWGVLRCFAGFAYGIEHLPVAQLINFGLEPASGGTPERNQKHSPDQIPEKHPNPNTEINSATTKGATGTTQGRRGIFL